MRLFRDDLRRAVGKGTIGVHRALQPRNQNLAETKINQLRIILIRIRYVTGWFFVFFFLSHHDIFELYIAMDYTAGMKVSNYFDYFPENYPRNGLYWLFVVFNPVE